MADFLFFLYTVVIYPVSSVIEFIFVFAHKLFKSAGFSIICVSGAVSVLCLPLYLAAEKQQDLERRIQKRLKPKVEKIKAVFKGDEQYLILTTYYRQNGYHPIYALRSAFSLLIQIPFFIAAYRFLSHLEILKGAAFLGIPDLGAPDGLLAAGPVTVNALPLVMTALNLASGALYTKGFAPKDKAQVFGAAAVFLALLYNAPAALALYWTGNNLFSLLKNLFLKIPFAGKKRVALALFSCLCVLLGAFCVLRYPNNPKAPPLAGLFALTALAPWLFAAGKKRLASLAAPFAYETGSTAPVFFAAVLTVWALAGLFLPTQLVVSSPQEFSFIDTYTTPLFFVFTTAFQAFGLFVFWPSCLYALFPSRVKSGLSLFFLCTALLMTVNAFLFPGNYGMISIDFVFDSRVRHSLKEVLANFGALLLVLCMALFFLYGAKRKPAAVAILSCGLFALLALSAVNIVKIRREFEHLKTYYVKEERAVVPPEPIASLSRTGTNLVVIMLDRGTSVFMPFIFEESPELREQYAGFTFYPNTVSFNGYTRIGAPPIFGGYEYTPLAINTRDTVPLVVKHNEALLMMPRMLSENGFSVVVTDPPYANYNWKSDLSIYNGYKGVKAYITDKVYTDFWMREHDFSLPALSAVIKRNLLWYGVLKGLPLGFRPFLYMDSSWLSLVNSHTLRLTLNGYSVLEYLPRLIPVTDEPLDTALLMVNNTTHEGNFFQAPDYRPAVSVTNYGNGRFKREMAYHTNAAAMKRLAEWFDLLKKEGVYDNTRIILVSDHGPESNFVTKIGLPINVDQFNPLLMVKDFGAKGALQTDTAFMSNGDVPALALRGIIENPTNPFTGNPITADAKNKPLYIAISGSIHIQDKHVKQFLLDPAKDYYVHTNIFDAANWKNAAPPPAVP